ncbi:hypothetical protein PI125_g11804 [Phytophthora idaei]|nr:hypothetical protein PI125_g11804 [Phytophthora idaei]
MSNTAVIEWSTDMYLIWDLRLLAFESARLSQSLTDRQLKQNTMALRQPAAAVLSPARDGTRAKGFQALKTTRKGILATE